jgi:alpha-L-fucosidase
MNRRNFLRNGAGLAAALGTSGFPSLPWIAGEGPLGSGTGYSHRLPANDVHYRVTAGYVEDNPVPGYTWASDEAYERFKDIKFGIRLHWGLYSVLQLRSESWPYLKMSLAERQAYQELYRSWYPAGFDADEWVDFFAESGARMFAFTSKHHDGFSMFDTKARVKKHVNWLAPGGPVMEDCDLAYSIMETPFRRDVVKELTTAAHKKDIKVDLYFSHPDWYDADFRPYNYHPLQVPGAATLAVQGKDRKPEISNINEQFGKAGPVIVPDPSPVEVDRMMKRHRAQLEELITQYGKIDMICLDQWLGPTVWPRLRETMEYLRRLRPDIMYRARGIGNYGDYYTPEGFVPGGKENTDAPWFVIYPLGNTFSYEAYADKHKGPQWIIRNLVDAVAKGGNFMVGIGPDGNGRFHPEAIRQLKQAGEWLKVNGEGIYGTRPRNDGDWKEGDDIRFTRTKDQKTVYVYVYEWPEKELVLQTVKPRRNGNIYFLGNGERLSWKYDSARGLVIQTPRELTGRLPEARLLVYGFKIEV